MFFRLCYDFLLERYPKRKNYEYDGAGDPIPYKIMFLPISKTVGEDAFLWPKFNFSGGGNTS